MRKTGQSDFSVYTDNPIGQELEHRQGIKATVLVSVNPMGITQGSKFIRMCIHLPDCGQEVAFFGAKLFEAEKLLVSHPYKNLMMFGACRQDFMLMVSQSIGSNATKDKPTEKHLFTMVTSRIRETTLLISSYINSAH